MDKITAKDARSLVNKYNKDKIVVVLNDLYKEIKKSAENGNRAIYSYLEPYKFFREETDCIIEDLENNGFNVIRDLKDSYVEGFKIDWI